MNDPCDMFTKLHLTCRPFIFAFESMRKGQKLGIYRLFCAL